MGYIMYNKAKDRWLFLFCLLILSLATRNNIKLSQNPRLLPNTQEKVADRKKQKKRALLLPSNPMSGLKKNYRLSLFWSHYFHCVASIYLHTSRPPWIYMQGRRTMVGCSCSVNCCDHCIVHTF